MIPNYQMGIYHSLFLSTIWLISINIIARSFSNSFNRMAEESIIRCCFTNYNFTLFLSLSSLCRLPFSRFTLFCVISTHLASEATLFWVYWFCFCSLRI